MLPALNPYVLIRLVYGRARVVHGLGCEECRWCGEGMDWEIPSCSNMNRCGDQWQRKWGDLDDKSKVGGKEGEMEEWGLVEGFFNRIHAYDPQEEEED